MGHARVGHERSGHGARNDFLILAKVRERGERQPPVGNLWSDAMWSIPRTVIGQTSTHRAPEVRAFPQSQSRFERGQEQNALKKYSRAAGDFNQLTNVLAIVESEGKVGAGARSVTAGRLTAVILGKFGRSGHVRVGLSRVARRARRLIERAAPRGHQRLLRALTAHARRPPAQPAPPALGARRPKRALSATRSYASCSFSPDLLPFP